MKSRRSGTTGLSRRAFLGGVAGFVAVSLIACGGNQAAPEAGGSTAPSVSPSASPVGYARGDILIDAQNLKQEIASGVRVVALTPRSEYDKGHIEGAVQIDWPDLELSDTSSDAPIQQWRDAVQRKLGALGLSASDRIVIYDEGSLFASRLWWVLDYLGHKDKRVLNGGLPAWVQANGGVVTGPANPAPATYTGTLNPPVLAQLSAVRAAVGDSQVVLLDVRSPDEYRAGHIPGAVNVPYLQNAVESTPKFWKSQADLQRMYAAAGIVPEKKIIPYCSTGVRSAVTFLTLTLIGYPDVALFSGSWAEWSAHPDLPVEK
jgi:thiosulfate/3-mercaptopyruvate sulfurtransferase